MPVAAAAAAVHVYAREGIAMPAPCPALPWADLPRPCSLPLLPCPLPCLAAAGQAAALVLYTLVGLASTALVLSITVPQVRGSPLKARLWWQAGTAAAAVGWVVMARGSSEGSQQEATSEPPPTSYIP